MKKTRELYEGEYLNDEDTIKYNELKYSYFEKLHIDLPIEQMTRKNETLVSPMKIQSIEIDDQIEPQKESLPQQIPFEIPQQEEIFTFTLNSQNQLLSSPPN